MSAHRRPLGTLLFVLACWPGLNAAPAGRSPFRVEASRMSMGCLYAIVAYGNHPAALAGDLEAALDEVDRIDRLMSHYREDSALSRLNREASRAPVAVDRELFDFLAEALEYSAAAGGAFDITVGPLMKAWGFFRGDGRLPRPQELAAARQRVGYHHVVLDRGRRTVQFERPGMELDLGGIAKGYAVDRAIGVLARRGIGAALVSAGGSTVYGRGSPPGLAAWDVAVQDPIDVRRTAFQVLLRDRALSVAGVSEKSFELDGVRYSHIMDPRVGRPVQGVLGVAVLSPTGTAGDALDDALFVLGSERGRPLLESHADTEAYFLLPHAGGSWRSVHLQAARPAVSAAWP